MHRNPGDFILPRHDVASNVSRMMFKGELKQVAYRRILHRHVNALLRSLNEAELAVIAD